MGMESNRNQIANPHSHTITHNLIVFNGVRVYRPKKSLQFFS